MYHYHASADFIYAVTFTDQDRREEAMNKIIHSKDREIKTPMEYFFGVLKKEIFISKEYEFSALDNLKPEIISYLEYYNNKRISLKLKGLTPVQYRNQS